MTEETNLDFLIDVENDIEIDLDNIKVPEKKKEITIDEYFDYLAEQEEERVLLFNYSF